MMPQLDFATFPSQLFWLAVNFALLYWLMAKVALPGIAKILQSRVASMDADLSVAAKFKAEAENIMAQYDKSIQDAKARARYLIQQASGEIQFQQEKQLSALDEKLEARLAEAQKRLSASKAKVLAEIKPLSAELAQTMVQKLLDEVLNHGGEFNARKIG